MSQIITKTTTVRIAVAKLEFTFSTPIFVKMAVSAATVSYTHLDVYKRQMPGLPNIPAAEGMVIDKDGKISGLS